MDCARGDHWRLAERLAQSPPVALFENFTKRISDGSIVLFAADFFLGRTVEPNEMIGCDTALLSVKFRELDRIGDGFIVNNNCRCSQRDFGASVDCEQKDERENAQGRSAAPRAMPIM